MNFMKLISDYFLHSFPFIIKMVINTFSKEFFPQAAKLFRQNAKFDIMPDFLFKEKTIDDVDFNPELTFCSFKDDKLVGFLMGVIRKRVDEKMAYVKLLCVDSNFRRQGIAAQLYNLFEEKILKENINVIRVYESFPNYFMPGIDPFYTEAICFFERKGFKKIGDTSNLICDLNNQNFSTDAEEEKLKGENIFCYRAKLKDKSKIFDWLKNLFPAWIDEVNSAYMNEPISVFVAEQNGIIKAFSAYEGNNKGTGWFGPMGTEQSLRGKKVGSILLKKCLSSMKELGFSKAIIPWVGPIPFYMNYANAYVQRVFWRYEKKFH